MLWVMIELYEKCDGNIESLCHRKCK